MPYIINISDKHQYINIMHIISNGSGHIMIQNHMHFGILIKQCTLINETIIKLNTILKKSTFHELYKLCFDNYLEHKVRLNLKKGIIKEPIKRLKEVICLLFSNIAFLLSYINKMPKILNKSGKCNNWTCQSKTLINKQKGTHANSVDTLLQKASRTIFSIMSGHPAKCAVIDNLKSNKSAAILYINLANTNKRPNIPFPAHMQRLNKWLLSLKYTYITLRGGICTMN